MCDNFPNIRITEGNNFSIILPLLSRTYVATRPIDEEIDPEQLENVVVTFGGVQYQAQRTTRGVQIDLPATLAVGTYNILLTAEYLGSNIRAAYESAVTIVPWSEQSTAEQYITGSPIVLRAAYVLSGALTDAELEALKEEYREKNAQLEQAIADAEAAKREWEEKAADLDGVAKQGDNPNATNTAILEAVQQGGGTDIAKESTSQQILTKIGSPASGQGADLFAAMRDIALSATTLQELADAWSAMVTNRNVVDGVYFSGDILVENINDALYRANLVVKVVSNYDGQIVTFPFTNVQHVELPNAINTTFTFNIASLQYLDLSGIVTMANRNILTSAANLKTLKMDNLEVFSAGNSILNLASMEELHFPSLKSIGGDQGLKNMPMLKIIEAPNLVSLGGSNIFTNNPKLIDIIVGEINSDAIFSGWSPTEALSSASASLVEEGETFASNLEKLLYNIREHIAANLQDRTGLSALTITFSAAVKAAILADQPTADAFTNKNWTIA